MKPAFFFPGQGAELSLLLARWARGDRRGPFRCGHLVRHAAEALGMSLDAIVSNGGAALTRTEVYQPLLVAVSLESNLALKKAGVEPAITAGHSLGELPAWCAAGGLDPRTAIALSVERGRHMAAAAKRSPGGLAVVMVSDDVPDEELLAPAQVVGGAHVAARNAPGQRVVGGSLPALKAIARRFRARALMAPGPWHGPSMAPAREPWARALTAVKPRPFSCLYVSGVTGRLVEDPRLATELLVQQLTEPVLWTAVLETVLAQGPTDLVVMAPGRLQRGLIRANRCRGVRVHSLDGPEDLDDVLEALA